MYHGIFIFFSFSTSWDIKFIEHLKAFEIGVIVVLNYCIPLGILHCPHLHKEYFSKHSFTVLFLCFCFSTRI